MKYYLHDSNSFNDEKVTELYLKFGYEGLGLFYTLLEKLASQEKPIKTEVLKAQLNVGKRLEKCWSFMESLGIIHSNNGETFNKQLLNFSEKYQIKKQKNTERIKQWRDNQHNEENVTSSQRVSNTPKVKLSKVKLSKDIYKGFAHLSLSVVELNKLLDMGFKLDQIDSTLEAIENYKKNTNYKSLYLTAKKWLENDKRKSPDKLNTMIDTLNRINQKHTGNGIS